MTKKEWIKNKLLENNFDNFTVYDFYEDYKKEFKVNITQGSYERMVRSNNRSVNKKNKDVIPDYSEYSREKLIEYIADYIEKTQNKVGVKEFAQIIKVPVGAFLKYVPDYSKVVREFYKDHLLHIKDDIKLEKVTKDLSLLKKELNYYKKEEYKHNKVLDLLEEVIKHYEPYKLKTSIIQPSKRKLEGVVLLSDFHFDESVNKDEMHGVNEYNIEIAKRRIDQLFETIISNSQYLKVDTINLLIAGDILSGNLHDLAENNELGLTHSILVIADYLSQHIRNLTKYFKTIRGVGVVGNHGRYDKFLFKKMQTNNFEYLLYEFIKRQTSDFFDFVIPQSAFIVHKINGLSMLTMHGMSIRGGTGLNSVPGNLSRDISLLSGTLAQSGINFDLVNMGHFHSANEVKSFSGAEIIMNGSLIGGNEFSLLGLKKAEKPSQTYYVVEKDYGVRYLDRIKLT